MQLRIITFIRCLLFILLDLFKYFYRFRFLFIYLFILMQDFLSCALGMSVFHNLLRGISVLVLSYFDL